MHSNAILETLAEIRSKGYIKPEGNTIEIYCQKINCALSELFKQNPVPPTDALQCMQEVYGIWRNTYFIPLSFQDTMLDLYDHALAGNDLTQKQAETRLLNFFSHNSPVSVKQKKRLLDNILKMSDFPLRRKEISSVIAELAKHYDENQQLDEDSDKSIIPSLSKVLNQVCETRISKPHSGDIRQEKADFATCAKLVKKYRPDLYNEEWKKEFTYIKRVRFQVPDIKEPEYICSRKINYSNGTNFSKGWENE